MACNMSLACQLWLCGFHDPAGEEGLPADSAVSSRSHSIPTSILDGCRLRCSPEEDENSSVSAAPRPLTLLMVSQLELLLSSLLRRGLNTCLMIVISVWCGSLTDVYHFYWSRMTGTIRWNLGLHLMALSLCLSDHSDPMNTAVDHSAMASGKPTIEK